MISSFCRSQQTEPWHLLHGGTSGSAAKGLEGMVMVVEGVGGRRAVVGSAVVGMGAAADWGRVAQGGWEAAVRVEAGVEATAAAGCK